MSKTALLALPASMLLTLANVSVMAVGLPKEWIDEALAGADERVHLVIKNHMKSRLDWRSYYLDRRETRRRISPSESAFQSPASSSPINNSFRATGDEPACPDHRPSLNGETAGSCHGFASAI
ncbi:MAG: hypothetical protein WBN68_14430 [Sedimenticolaceae bacterium]